MGLPPQNVGDFHKLQYAGVDGGLTDKDLHVQKMPPSFISLAEKSLAVPATSMRWTHPTDCLFSLCTPKSGEAIAHARDKSFMGCVLHLSVPF
jgi:hypothetical protein